MMNQTHTVRILLLSFLVVPALSGCGGMEWGPRDWEKPRVSRPAPSAPVRAAAVPGTVLVVKGDSVYGLSRRHGIPARAIIEANGLRPPYHLRIGQRITLPKVREHVVGRGDTLSGISANYGIGFREMARANGITEPYTVYPGQRLIVPEEKPQSQAARPAIRERPVPPKPSRTPTTVARASKPRAAAAIPRPPARGGKGFAWPLRGRIVSTFGSKSGGLRNDGINVAAPRGTPVRAVENGVVAYAGNELKGFGNLVLVKHQGGWVSAYAHVGRMLVGRGDTVRKGGTIATVGSTGTVSVPQLHFELRKGKKAVDPRRYLNKSGGLPMANYSRRLPMRPARS
jgi:murein DD-endopeptidase MepM/ murein hydrolase activator NlpD